MATGAKFVTAREAMVIAARAMANSEPDDAALLDARVVYAGAAQIEAGCQVARQTIQADDLVPVPDYLYNVYADTILSQGDA